MLNSSGANIIKEAYNCVRTFYEIVYLQLLNKNFYISDSWFACFASYL